MDKAQPIPTANGRDLLNWVLRRRRRLRVTGPSMEPVLFDGDVVFVDTDAYENNTPRDLDIVVAKHPSQGLEIVKRIEFTTDAGAYLVSENPDAEGASDSRKFGVIALELIIGRVTAVSPATSSSTIK